MSDYDDFDKSFDDAELQDDNFGEDPYNRTGQFCRLALKDRE